MRISAFLLLVTILQTFANDAYSQKTRISLEFSNTELTDVLDTIEECSEFFFLYNEKLVNTSRVVSHTFKNQKINKILDELFTETDIVYTIADRKIILAPSYLSDDSPQQLTVSGKVTDSYGTFLPGVTIVVKGTTRGIITDADGAYVFPDIAEDATLVFSYVGMKTQEIPVEGRTEINIAMTEEIIGIEEVVAIGYGTVKKSDLTGAVGSVRGEAIAEREASQVSQALQGAMAGVMVTRSSGTPGGSANINIRGITSIGDSSPLIIMDGVPVGNINDINPNDIESISVLKDAASASIYGARAASGVILVTTKRAKNGDLKLSYNTEFGFEKPTTLPEFVNAVRFMEIENETRWNDNINEGSEYPTYTKDIIDNYTALHAENPDMYPDTDWMGLVLADNAPKQSHVISLSAGSQNIKTNASIGYDKIGALYEGAGYERVTTRFNNDVTINKMLSTSIDFYFKRSNRERASIDPMYPTLISAPVYAATWQDGRVAEGKQGHNVYGQIKYGGNREAWYNKIGGKASIDFTPIEGLKISGVVSPTYGFDKQKNFYTAVPYYSADDPTVYIGTLQWESSTRLWEDRSDNYQLTTQALVNYVKSFGTHNFNVLGGYENYYAFYESLTASRDQYDLTSFPYLDLGPLELRDNSGSAIENAYRSWFGRIMYNFNNKYYLQANIRLDNSSRFHEDYRLGSFPSLSAGWIVSEESFMQNVRGLSFLKLRGSWGTLGNERIGNYPYQATIAFANSLFYQAGGIVSAQTAAQTQLAIQNISWETTESIDFGVDATFFDNKLRFTGDYFIKKTKDMLLELEIPDYIGFDNPYQNTGEMATKGWEAELGWNDIAGDLRYSFSFNISDFKSEMGDLGGTEFLGDQVKFEGSEFNEWYGYLSDGLFQTQEEVNNSPVLDNTVSPGDVKYLDISGPDGEPDGIISPEYDRVLLGGSLPRYLFGATIRLNFKGFDFSMVIQGVGKQNSKLGSTMVRPLIENWGNAQSIVDGNYWSHYKTDEQNLDAKYPRLSWNSGGNNYAMSDYWLINGSYLRMKNITLGYSIPASLTQKANIQGIRIYVSASDLFTIDNYPKGWDPEVASSGYPITSSYVFGATINF